MEREPDKARILYVFSQIVASKKTADDVRANMQHNTGMQGVFHEVGGGISLPPKERLARNIPANNYYVYS